MIKAYTGKTGSGKSYLMIRDAFAYWKKGVDIYSNTVLDFEKFRYSVWDKVYMFIARKKELPRGKIRYFDQINEVIDIQEGLVIFDEAQVLFNSRNWESLPDEFQYKLQQHRKHKIDLICTAQRIGAIDITYRTLIHSWINCHCIFQLGSSPRILFGLFRKEEKDVDGLQEAKVDPKLIENLRTKLLIINYFSRALYDTMFDIGFRKFKLVWITKMVKGKRYERYLIIPKKMSLSNALREIRLYRSLLREIK